MRTVVTARVVTGGTSTCPHTEHGKDTCGYVAAVDYVAAVASVSCNSNCSLLADDSFIHLKDCTYMSKTEAISAVIGVDCTHACALCKPQVEVTPPPLAQECNCTKKCTAIDGEIAAVINAECPVCGAEKADLTAYVFKSEKAARSIALYFTTRKINKLPKSGS